MGVDVTDPLARGGVEGRAVAEGPKANLLEAGWEIDGGEGVAVKESALTNGGHTIWEGEGGESGVAQVGLILREPRRLLARAVEDERTTAIFLAIGAAQRDSIALVWAHLVHNVQPATRVTKELT